MLRINFFNFAIYSSSNAQLANKSIQVAIFSIYGFTSSHSSVRLAKKSIVTKIYGLTNSPSANKPIQVANFFYPYFTNHSLSCYLQNKPVELH